MAFAAAAESGTNSGVLLDRTPNSTQYELIDGAALSAVAKLDLWHYSGGYWKVTNPDSGTIQVPDSVMGQGDGLVIPAKDAVFTLNLPKQVREAVAQGKTVVPVIQSGSGVSLSELFELPGSFSMDSSKLTFKARPKFHLIRSRNVSFQSPYGLNMAVSVPLIERKYGYNMYSVFGNGYQSVQVNGYVDPDAPLSMAGMPAGWIHPSMIKDTTGAIKSGHQLMINSRLMDSAGFSVGKGTFANAGALGLCFEYPVRFSFYIYNEKPEEPEIDPPEPPEPERTICRKCGQCELTEEGNCSETSCPHWETPDCGCYVPPEVEAEAILSVPGTTYESHPVMALDQSRFRIDGELYSAAKAYREGHARNSFSIVESGAGTVRRDPDSRIEAIVTFPQKGIYRVQLRVAPKYGGALYDTKPVEVKKTPTVLAALGGVQKQNRKQVLSVKVATNSSSPLEKLWIELKQKETGETVRLVHNLKNPANNVLKNTQIIKTRAIAAEESDIYWTRCRLEFLTKNTAAEDFTYRVYAQDSRGMWDEVSADFTVQPDKAPEAKIEVEPVFLREPGENRAVIKAKDISVTDGDQLERTWSVANTAGYDGVSDIYSDVPLSDPFSGSTFTNIERLAGYQDQSFGTRQSVRFDRTGVGKIRLRLDIKDVWTDETLPEYITEDDYLTASAVAETEIANVAPVVSMEPLSSKSGEVLLLAGGEKEYETLIKAAAELKTGLLENNIDADVLVSRIEPAPNTEEDDTSTAVGGASVSYGYRGSGSSFWEKRAALIDNSRLYKAEATWRQGERPEDCYPSMPFRIYAYDAGKERESDPLWSCTITESLIGKEDSGETAELYQDEDGVYLYFVAAGKTVVIEKSTGAILTCLPFELGEAVSVGVNRIFSYQSDGIYLIRMDNGTRQEIVSESIISKIKRIAGCDHFLVKEKSALMRGVFDPKTGEFYMSPLLGGERDDGRTGYALHGIDVEGRMLISRLSPAAGSSDGRRLTIGVYGTDNNLIQSSSCQIDRQDDYAIAPVCDGSGRYHYYALVRNAARGTQYDRTYATVWGIDQQFTSTVTLENRHGDGYPTAAENILAAEEREDGNIYLVTGAYREYWDSIGGYPGKAQGRGEEMRAFRFDPQKNTAAEYKISDEGIWKGIDCHTEYAVQSDAYIALTVADNHLDQERAHNTTKIMRRSQRIEDILLRCVNRSFSGKKDVAALLVYDETNEAECKAPKDFLELLREKNINYLFAGSNSKTGYGLQLAEAAGERGKAADAGNLAEVLLSTLMKDEDESNVLQVKTTQKNGNVSREYRLSPNTQYYYEYDYRSVSAADGTESKNAPVSDPFSFTAHSDRQVPAGTLLSEQYVVTESFEEDFNDPRRADSYFSGLEEEKITGGQYNLAYLKETFGSNKYRGAEGSLRFTVPEGKQAVLSWDYDFLRDNADDWNMGYYIDGKLWNHMPVGSSFRGHYTHTKLLPAGTHTLAAKTGAYGRHIEIWGKIDNLRVDFVELCRTESGETQENAMESEASVQVQNGWNHVRGSFRTPGRAKSYTAAPTQYCNTNLAENSGELYEWKSRARGSKEIEFLFNDTPVDYAAVNFSIDSGGSKTVNCKIGGRVFTSSSKTEPQTAMASIRGEFNAILQNQSENVAGTITHNSFNNPSNGNFNRLEAAKLGDGSAQGIMEENRFFLAPLEDGKTSIFVENDRFDGGTELCFAPAAAGDYQLRDLKIYSIQNGVRVYAEDSSLGEQNTPLLWTPEHAEMTMVSLNVPEDEEEQKLIYRKGELVDFKINYWDYENDPSKSGRWRYTHTPFNDGAHPQAAVILNEDGTVKDMPGGELSEPIKRFYIDGKYTVEHWQEDNTRRGKEILGNPDYDKKSNIASMIFYVQGGGTAPWITHIATIPAVVKESDQYRLKIGVNDAEKDELSLTAEVYCGGKRVAVFRRQGLKADASGHYPDVTTDLVPVPAQVGKYEVVCTVRDQSGVGIGNYKFNVVSAEKLTGWVYHTDEWDQNRKQYNTLRFGAEYNKESDFSEYKKQVPPRRRGTNVFWSGERFMLRAAAGGDPDSVTCSIPGSGYSVRMKYTGRRNAQGERIYEGTLWNSDMLHKWGRSVPEELIFRFKAKYGEASEKLCDVRVIVDQFDEYWKLHRFS